MELTKIKFKELLENAINKAEWYLRACNAEQINYHVNMIERDLRSKYFIVKE